jgi:hypothetical protein
VQASQPASQPARKPASFVVSKARREGSLGFPSIIDCPHYFASVGLLPLLKKLTSSSSSYYYYYYYCCTQKPCLPISDSLSAAALIPFSSHVMKKSLWHPFASFYIINNYPKNQPTQKKKKKKKTPITN